MMFMMIMMFMFMTFLFTMFMCMISLISLIEYEHLQERVESQGVNHDVHGEEKPIVNHFVVWG